ncbi:MAG: nucleotidyl transferase AbiEii/AbiGii toxin family protein [Saprospiraceae bacterium]|nr:nucleotidyl transferase AbiEii/AbiGii toxin family protein [Saprospiraceae bacterium]
MADEALGLFNLVGGTALSLQIGHRKSIDLDMFPQSDFEADTMLKHLDEAGYEPQVRHLQKQTLIAEIQGIKVDFIRFRYPFAQDILVMDGIRMANIKDIACMKIDAIMGRGRKKDFFDLYFLLQRFSLTDMMSWYAQMFKHSTLFHVYKSLIWFDDADLDGELDVMDKKVNWEKVKKTIVKAVEKAI